MKKIFNKQNIIVALVLCVFVLLAYGNALNHQFLLDDEVLLFQKPTLGDVSYGDILSKPFKGFYRPFAYSVLKLSLNLFGRNVFLYHLFNLILFYVICVLFYFLLIMLTGNVWLALLASSLYAAHPINNFLINYKTASNLSLYVLYMQASAILFCCYIKEKKGMFFMFSLFTYFCALMCHETSFLLPLYLFLMCIFCFQRKIKDSFLLVLTYLIPFVIYCSIFFSMKTRFQLDTMTKLGVTFAQYVEALSGCIGWYLSKLIIPTHIIFIWDELIQKNPAIGGFVFVWICVIAALAFILIRQRKTVWGFGLAMFILGFLPVCLASFTYTAAMKTAIIEPHWLGFPSIGFFLCVAWFIVEGLKKMHVPQKACLGLGLAVALTCAFLTSSTNNVWSDSQSYCTYWLSENSYNGTAWHCMADNYLVQKDQGLKKDAYQSCREVAFIGLSRHVKGDGEGASKYYSLASQTNGGCAEVYYGLSALHMSYRNPQKASAILERAKKMNPDLFPAYEMILDGFNKQGHVDDGRKIMELMRSTN